MIKLSNVYESPPVLRCLGGINWGNCSSPNLGKNPYYIWPNPTSSSNMNHHSLGCAMGWALAKELLPWTLFRAEQGRTVLVNGHWHGSSSLEKHSWERPGTGRAVSSALAWGGEHTSTTEYFSEHICPLSSCRLWSSAKASLELSGCSELQQWRHHWIPDPVKIQ